MRKRRFIYLSILLAVVSLVMVDCISDREKPNFSERVKIALRDSGNQLLLAHNDSTSLVFPIVQLENDKFELSFQNRLSIVPDSIVNVIRHSLKTLDLPSDYIVEVFNCNNGEVAYSYQIAKSIENTIIPCIGRNLPFDCYSINVLFTSRNSFLTWNKNYSLLSVMVFSVIAFVLFYRTKEKNEAKVDEELFHLMIGNYKFYKCQNQLVKGDVKIQLTSKECELMEIFGENLNQIVKRDLLIKRVWEDNGVFVGRSLDTFISKLRKKFKDDDSINIVNVHGVGYKLETVKRNK